MFVLRHLITPVFLLAAWSAAAGSDDAQVRAVDLRQLPTLEAIIPQLAEKRVVFVGETHDRYSHHLNQLAIIRGLHRHHPNLAIGLEFFQQPFQPYLDAYIAGELSEQEMLRKTEYFTRWKFDYRLYRPILRYAREQGLKLIALNIPSELTQKVASGGLEGLTEAERERLPAFGEADERYRQRLKAIFEQHPHGSSQEDFERFVQAQLLWDEGMAERAADYLTDHPDRPLVILAGSGHLAYGIGIPSRLQRRVDVTSALVLNDPQEALTPDIADFILLTGPQPLPAKGRLGIFMEDGDPGVRVSDFAEESAAKAAGLQKGDHIVRLAGQTVNDPVDVQLALIDGKAGERIDVTVAREGWLGERETFEYSITLR